jgi:hypothetical protein
MSTLRHQASGAGIIESNFCCANVAFEWPGQRHKLLRCTSTTILDVLAVRHTIPTSFCENASRQDSRSNSSYLFYRQHRGRGPCSGTVTGGLDNESTDGLVSEPMPELQ